ncbi:DNA-directed RNA polymerase subunit beta [Thermoclostridium stercorarium subsp. stercorarium DSM 8532]|jgi:DNA-directed RNA polymerase subunit beta|uniref:DNA-directed RNA polymerase subunit beta n=3 Tax=Thermoclostridium stercorarium TaxID=1510 RepID=L7VLF3_THES1|nr:DNA-directed RNA polymerase subunit beta [Thermoclostridium stercorarium]AGC67321.1 DNA-directed RNA polymerase subunit beta [Thermoclostridium stercorarium subsp. stercorarium DSM 8532]AGI38383.1 DNA-directed RNA polymerase beta subunit [Thermoclostridium stercorarium subsp. stercorarium DSM 8532]ANW97819.1 DNA-directed RNA polymerase subunit beta [Thermoclostridium stercorarium subsp. thermolacticum DSM 2910]ANX00345.1 DNA-directed RNA polymerase subunit beta [Thermoclostridium stercorariu
MVHPVKLGRTTRMSYSKIEEVLEMPNLIEVQKNSYQWFLDEGLREVLRDVSPITDYTGNLIMEFIDYSLDLDNIKYSIEECKERDATYSAPLKVKVRLINKETGEVKEQDIFMGDFPLMTETGTFVINGAERVIVSQLVRSPGVYYSMDRDKLGKKLYSTTVIPNRGAWLEYETDSNNVVYVRIDRTRKLPITVLLRALGYGTDAQLMQLFGEEEKLLATIQKDNTKSEEEGLLEVYKRLRPGEPPTVESASALLTGLFFDPKRYDLSKVGRYKFNKKLALAARIRNHIAAEDIVDGQTGEILVEKGQVITSEVAWQIQNSGVNVVNLDINGKTVKVIGNNTVDIQPYINFDAASVGINEKVRYDVLKEILNEYDNDEDIKRAVIENKDLLIPKTITIEDIVATVNYIFGLDYGIGSLDDIDHLGNRRLRSVGELLQNQFRIGLARMERVIRERMTIQDLDAVTPQALINIRPVAAAIKEFFGSSQLSQFMDQTNPLSELTHKRRLSALGPGGLSRERAGFEVRDVHHSHYGRMCPIETPEGPNIGLISSLSTYARVNEYGFIEAPYRKVDKATGRVTNEVYYMTADEEDGYVIAEANEPLDEEGRFINKKIGCRYQDQIIEVSPDQVDFMDVSPKQLVSVATSMIPFLENDDANRALMGSNMQRQAVPLIRTEAPIVATGIEYKAAIDSGVCVLAKADGVVESVSATEIVIRREDGKKDVYKLLKYKRSNQGTCINQRPIVRRGDIVKKGDVIADGPSTDQGELALGRNVLIGFMTWEGYNYEDAVLISEELVRDDVYTSIHIEEYEAEARDTKLGPEEITRDIPNVGEDSLKDLDERGIIRIGAEVRAGDILVGKVTPKGETELTAEERLLRAIFGEKAREVRDTSLRVPHGESGIVVDVKVFSRDMGDELPPGVNQLVRVYVAQKRKISVGDKMAGRHGNKGVISRILPVEDMPFLPDGTPLQVVLNPLGVPSRMNIGQVLEVHLGYAAKALGWKVATPVFDGATENDVIETLKLAGLPEDGKTVLYDGRTGEPFDSRVTVGYMYYLKLAHLVDDKIHARSTGPYSLVTQQPLGGKAQFGGQRFGEMEVWALEAYGAAYSLQELLTVKSDDVVGRVKTYEAIVKGENVPEPGIPESFKVLIKELQSLCLDVKVFSEEHNEIEIKESVDDDYDELEVNLEGREGEEIPRIEEDYGTDSGSETDADIDSDTDADDFIDDDFSVDTDLDSLEDAEELDEDAVDRLFGIDDDDDLLDDDDI